MAAGVIGVARRSPTFAVGFCIVLVFGSTQIVQFFQSSVGG